MIGKISPDDLAAHVLSNVGAPDDAVLVGPAYGEDAAAIRVGEQLLVVSSDPISLAAERIGTLGIHVACNDVAASGAEPRWLSSVVFLPGARDGALATITRQLHEAASELGVAIVGGHSEYAPELSRPLLSLTCLGLADEFVPTSGANPGDLVVLTKGAAIEGTAILASDFREDLSLPAEVIDRAAGFFAEISVVRDADIVAPRATAMHDPTEGGVLNGLVELATASGVALEVERSAIPVRDETARLCEAMDVDPLCIFGSGALLATVPEAERAAVLTALEDAGIDASVVGRAVESDVPEVRLDGAVIREAVRDDLYDLWA